MAFRSAVKDARFHHSMVVLHSETIFHQLGSHASPPTVLLLDRLSVSCPAMAFPNKPAFPRSSLRSIPPGGLPSHSKADAPAIFTPGARGHPRELMLRPRPGRYDATPSPRPCRFVVDHAHEAPRRLGTGEQLAVDEAGRRTSALPYRTGLGQGRLPSPHWFQAWFRRARISCNTCAIEG